MFKKDQRENKKRLIRIYYAQFRCVKSVTKKIYTDLKISLNTKKCSNCRA